MDCTLIKNEKIVESDFAIAQVWSPRNVQKTCNGVRIYFGRAELEILYIKRLSPLVKKVYTVERSWVIKREKRRIVVRVEECLGKKNKNRT